MTAPAPPVADEPPLRVMALHALEYCERLFYLEEVENLLVADDRVYAGRELHERVLPDDGDVTGLRSFELSSDSLGLFGKVDAARKRPAPGERTGYWVAYELKRGRCRQEGRARGRKGTPAAWPSDRLQAIAYALLLEEEAGEPVAEARVRYHADGVTVRVPVDEPARRDLAAAVARARELRRSDDRPPVTDDDRKCARCSLRVVCLPEEDRLPVPGAGEEQGPALEEPTEHVVADGRGGLFPANRDGRVVHVASPDARVSRSGRSLVVAVGFGEEATATKIPMHQVDAVALHGHAQMTTQAILGCVREGIAVQWLTPGGKAAGTLAPPGRIRQRRRQYAALADDGFRFSLARRLAHAKVENQLRYLLRGTRGDEERRTAAADDLARIRACLSGIDRADSPDALRGLEGMAAKHYFAALGNVLAGGVPAELRFSGRSRRPPRDRFNALLSFGYALLHSLCERTLIAVGLEPAFGFFHTARSAAPPLVLDLQELFRTSLWDVPLVGSLNRGAWDPTADFELRPGHVWLSEEGRKKAIGLFERRLNESYRHPHTGRSLAWGRIVELEARLLEKEWTGSPGHFARLRIR
ncbi:type I-MYXAN CRISPR-associated endonuclease Cas1 [Alienimonas sp. DA493]|uniref:type I-MYXAN CRISPR-associated endonuclease Cas1 n=1 Tax=Alienimonas sp. DA493 TaxID=3373605 RepID=UPI00375417EB